MEIHKIAETESSTLIGMNGGLIESPDGSKIVYAAKKDLTKKDGMEIWICSRDFTWRKKLYTCACGNHNGPSASFIDNERIVFRDMSGERSKFVIMNIETGAAEYSMYAKESHRAENGIYPFSVPADGENIEAAAPEAGIYGLDTKTGKIRMLVSSAEIEAAVTERGLTPTENTVSVSHVQLSPSADAVMARLSVKECPVFGALACFDLDTGKTHLIPDKPVHQLWFDNDTYMAARQFADGRRIEMETSYIARFSKDGRELEVLGGIANHIDGNPGRTVFAGDRCYPGVTPDVYVYERGNRKPIITVPAIESGRMTWELQVHPNPSFSADGKRLYFNRAVSETKTEASYIDIDI